MIRPPPRSPLFPSPTLSRPPNGARRSLSPRIARHFRILTPAPIRAHTRTHEAFPSRVVSRSEEHTSELQSPDHLVCRLLLEKKKKKNKRSIIIIFSDTTSCR